jgi:hypothetical protein
MDDLLRTDMLDHCLPEDMFEIVIEQQALSHFTSAEGPVRCFICYEKFSPKRRLAFTISDYGICTDNACLDVLKTLYSEAKILVQDLDEDDPH